MPSRAWVTSTSYKAAIDAIRSARIEAGLSVRDVGTALGKPHSWMNKIELLERRLDIIEFIALAPVLGMTPDELLQRLQAAIPAKFDI